MKTIVRIFFHSIGLALLVSAWLLNPESAQFKDLLQMLHANVFWQLTAVFATLLLGADMMMSGKIIATSPPAKGVVGAGRAGK
jgi:hypothetical protein